MKTVFFDRVSTIKYTLTDGSVNLETVIVEDNDTASLKWDAESQWEGYAKSLVCAYHCGLDWEKAEVIMIDQEDNTVACHIVTVWREDGLTTHEVKYL